MLKINCNIQYETGGSCLSKLLTLNSGEENEESENIITSVDCKIPGMTGLGFMVILVDS